MLVKATAKGFYGAGKKGKRMRPGEVFQIENEKQFSPKWMEKVEPPVEAKAKK